MQFFDGTTLLGTASTSTAVSSTQSSFSLTIATLNAGTHAAIRAVYTATGNFTGSSSANITQTVNMANATITVTGYTVVQDGSAHVATGTAVGVFGESLSGLNLSNTSHASPGTYNDPWTFTDVTGNYNNISGTVLDKITF